MEDLENIIELRLASTSKKDVNPSSFRGREVAELINNFESSLIAIIEKENPEINTNHAFISLVEVQDGSLKLGFKANIAALMGAFTLLTTALNSNSFEGIPVKSFEKTKEIHRIAQRKGAKIEFYNPSVSIEPIAQISPDQELAIDKDLLIQGETTIYAKILRIGGREPRVRIETIQGQTLSIRVREEEAKELAHRLYDEVALRGIGVWRFGDTELFDFKLIGIEPYQETPIYQAVSELSSLVGKYWDEINPDEYTQELRED